MVKSENAYGRDEKEALTVRGQAREWLRASLLDILEALLGRVGRRLLDRWNRNGNGLRAVREFVRIVPEHCHLRHGLHSVSQPLRGPWRNSLSTYILEAVHHQLLVVDHVLPETCRLRIARDREVGLEPQFILVSKTRVDFRAVGVVDTEGDTNSLEKHFKEDLRVERERGRVEGDRLVARNKSVRARDGVRREQVHSVLRRQASIAHARKDLLDGVLGKGDSTLLRWERRIRATGEELQARSARTVGDSDSARKLDEVTRSNGELL